MHFSSSLQSPQLQIKTGAQVQYVTLKLCKDRLVKEL